MASSINPSVLDVDKPDIDDLVAQLQVAKTEIESLQGSLTGLNKSSVGLANVDNTSDANKPVSTAQQTALDAKAAVAGQLFTGGIGYNASLRANVAQATSKATAVTLNNLTGTVTTHNAALAANTAVSFTVNNSQIALDDTVIAHRQSGGTNGAYDVCVDAVAAGSCVVTLKNKTGGSLSEAVVIKLLVMKG